MVRNLRFEANTKSILCIPQNLPLTQLEHVICVWLVLDLVLVFVGLGLFQICSYFPFSPHSKYHALHCMRTKCPPYSAIFTTGTVDICLAHHQKQLGATDVSMPPQYSEIIPSLRILMPTAASTADWHTSTRAQPSADHPISMEPCSKCDLHCALAASLYEDLVGIKNFSTMSVVANNDVEVMSHQASGFYLLHKKVTLKEMTSQSQHIKGLCGGSWTKLSECTTTLAANDLQHFQNMPTSHKWMWGETLTHEDVLNLWHICWQCKHTGYEMTLKPGVLCR